MSISGFALPHLTPHTHWTPDNVVGARSCHVLNIAAYLTVIMDKLQSFEGSYGKPTKYICRVNRDFRNACTGVVI